MKLPHLTAFAKNPLIFLTVCSAGRAAVLANPFVHETLVQIWTESAARNGWFVGRYVLMPDHVHLFAMSATESHELADWIGLWKSLSARAIVRRTRVAGRVWQRDYFDHFLRSADSYGEKWQYVRDNPVRASLAVRAEDWPYQGIINDLAY